MTEVKGIHETEQKCSFCGKTKRVAIVTSGGGGEVHICQKDLWKFLELQAQMNGHPKQ